MTLPTTPIVQINLSSGAGFGNAFILGTSRLGQAVLSTSADNIVDVTASVVSISTRKERNLLQDKYLSGTATVRIIDPNGDWNPLNTASPYYGLLQPLRRIKVEAEWQGTEHDIFYGYITEYRYTYPQSQETGYVDFICSDGFRLLFNSNVTTVTGQTAGQDTGTRIDKILNTISWPTSLRSIQTGQTTCQADPGTSRSAQDAIHTAEFTEQGAFYFDKSGVATFKNRNFVYNAASGIPTIFSNATGSSDITYANIKFALDDKTIVNKALITRIGGTQQVYSDATSIGQYFLRAISADNLLMQTDANALSLATAYVTARKDTTLRIDSITLDLTTPNYDDGVTAALDIDYFDVMEITNQGQEGVTVTKTLQCQGIAHDITQKSWKTTFTTQEPLLDTNY